jgi:hypothetical protein
MLEIVGVVVNMNVWTRIKLAEGAVPFRALADALRSSSGLVVDVTVEVDLVGHDFVRRREGRTSAPTSIW